MARSPYTGVNSATAGGVPDDYLHVQANPSEFGGLIAQGTEKLGQGEVQAGDSGLQYATQVQHMFNEAQVNKAQADYLDASNGILHAPPQVGADGLPVPGTGGFYNTRGDQSMPAYDAALKTLNDKRDEIAGSLANPRQQIMFDQLTRRLHDYSIMDMGRHVDQQVTQAADAKTQSLLDTTGQSAVIAATAGHIDRFDELMDQGQAAAKSWGQLRGYGDDWGNKYAQRFVGSTVQNVARQLTDQGNLQGAADLVSRYRDKMDIASSLAVDTHLKGAFQDKTASDFANNLVYGGSQANSPDLNGIAGKIIQIEGTGQNGQSSAAGTGQFIKSTWLQQLRALRPDLADKSDQDLLSMRENPDVGRSVTTAYAAQNAAALTDANLPASPGNIYLAHHFGADGAIKILNSDPSAPISSVVSPQVISANPDLAGKTVAQVKETSEFQMSGVGATAAVKQDKASALAHAYNAFQDDPTMQRKAIEAVNRSYTALQTAASADALATKQRQEAALDGYQKQIMMADEKPLPQDFVHQIANDPNISPEARKSLYTMAQDHLAGAVSGDIKSYGPGFTDAIHRLSLPAGDPQRISTNADALALYGETGLSVAGVGKVQEMMAKLQKNPDGAADVAMQKSALDYIRRQVSYADEFRMIKDPVGEDNYNGRAVPAFYKAYQDGLSKGLSPYEMLDTNNPKNIVKPIAEMFPKHGPDAVAANIDRGTQPASVTAGLKRPFEMDLSTYDLKNPADQQKAKEAIVSTYKNSLQRREDWDRAHAMLDQLTQPQAPVQ